tara:strand:+ start:62 stop:229 length:168 start_codon:yes stop_codon:yes gene_type:complete
LLSEIAVLLSEIAALLSEIAELPAIGFGLQEDDWLVVSLCGLEGTEKASVTGKKT